VNDRKVELIEDALGGFNVANCNETCTQTHETTTMTNATVTTEVLPKSNTKKFVVDVVEMNESNSTNDEVFQDNSGNLTLDDSLHKRIVRVSLQKSTRKNQICFRGGSNDSFEIYDLQKLVRNTEKYQNNINIRFKTVASEGLMFLIYQKFPNEIDTFMSLSIEKG
jgi:hypothetical protein